jgi:hypothetical protein
MKIAAITPTLGKRPEFMNLCRNYVERQTVKCEHIIVDDKQILFPTDLTWRYKLGIERAKAIGCEVAIIFEDDDWYHPEYAQRLIEFWKQSGRPQVAGIADSHYFHIGFNKYWHSKHPGRSSMCAMLLNLNHDFNLPVLTEIWLDIHLCQKNTGAYFVPPFPLVVGIKHGIGQCGGVGHRKNFAQYIYNTDWLKDHIKEDIKLYKNLSIKSKMVCV